MKTDAKTATQFLKDRSEADLAVPTEAQIERAKRAAAGPHRHFNTPLGIVYLALQLPLSKREKRGLKLKPVRRPEPKADREMVEQFLASGGFAEPAAAVEQIAAMAGYESMQPALKRVARYARSGRNGKVPAHIRSQMSLVAAGALVVELMAEKGAA